MPYWVRVVGTHGDHAGTCAADILQNLDFGGHGWEGCGRVGACGEIGTGQTLASKFSLEVLCGNVFLI